MRLRPDLQTRVTAARFLEKERELHRQAESASFPREFVLVWECEERAVILGRGGRAGDQVHAGACHHDNVPILRRDSGGGAVLLGPGCLGYTLILHLERRPHLRDIEASYRCILGDVAQAAGLARAEQSETDLVLSGHKFAGCSQRRMRRTLLHHGTLLYDFAIVDMERYLSEPARRPAYRGERGHVDFVANAAIHPAFAGRLRALYPEAEWAA